MSTLKPCPFCGGTKICTEKSINLNYCDNCSAESNIEHWNTRPIEDALNARIAELEGLVDKLIEIGDKLVFPDGMFDDEQSIIERNWRILTKAIKERKKPRPQLPPVMGSGDALGW